MDKQNPFLFKEISNSEHWRVTEIILTQCLKYPDRKIIKFIDGPEWTFMDLKIKSLQKARILKNLNLNKDIKYCLTPNQTDVIPYRVNGSLKNLI